MRRYTSFSLLVALGVVFPILFTFGEEGLTQAELDEARGGDLGSARCIRECHGVTGVYVGCEQAGGSCQQCGTVSFLTGKYVATSAFVLGEPGDTGCVDATDPGYKKDVGVQNCGTVWEGTCVADPNSPTGFVCHLQNTEAPCPGPARVVEQTGPVPID
jgi:hypothetical protein